MVINPFRRIRELEQQIAEMQTAQARLQASNEHLSSANEQMREWVKEARQGEVNALKMLVNMGLGRAFSVTPYPDAPHLPEQDLSADGPQMSPEIVQVRDLSRQANARFWEQYREQYQSLRKQ